MPGAHHLDAAINAVQKQDLCPQILISGERAVKGSEAPKTPASQTRLQLMFFSKLPSLLFKGHSWDSSEKTPGYCPVLAMDSTASPHLTWHRVEEAKASRKSTHFFQSQKETL